MRDTLRARFRSILDAVTGMTRLLPMLGFGPTGDPPTERVQRSEPTTSRVASASTIHDELPVDERERLENLHPKR